MGYQKQNFVSGQVLNSAHLNHIENGIVEIESSVSTSLADKVTKEELKNTIDPTLSLSGKAADAKATGDAVQGVKDDLAAETARAQAAESALSTKITDETERAKAAEQALDTRTAAIESCGFVVVDGKICVKYVKR